MKCRRVQKNLSAYADGELGPKLARRVAEHLAACGRCAAELSGLEQVSEAAKTSLRGRVSAKASPSDLRQRVMQATEAMGVPRPLLVPVAKLVAGAAIIVLATGLAVGVVLGSRLRSERELFVRTAALQRRELAGIEKDFRMARTQLVETRARLREVEEELRLASAERDAGGVVAQHMAAPRGAWPPVLSSLQVPGARGLLENGLF